MADKDLIKRDSRYYESIPKRIGNELVVLLLTLVSILPFWIIYGISDFLYVVLNYVVGYRKKVIYDNLTHAFPEKNADEIKTIANKFYHHFCDFSLETVKLHSMSQKQIDKRVKVVGTDILNSLTESGKSIVLMGFHYSNWEWASSMQTKSKHQLLMVYSPLRGNSAMERFISHSRGKWGGKSIPIHKTARALLSYIKKGEPAALWLAADQRPPANSPFWTTFLNREAPFFSGPEKIAMKTNNPVIFTYMRKIGRGKYEGIFQKLIDEPQKMESKDILLTYIRRMEEIIYEAPEYYLWSHKRWIHKRPENIPLVK